MRVLRASFVTGVVLLAILGCTGGGSSTPSEPDPKSDPAPEPEPEADPKPSPEPEAGADCSSEALTEAVSRKSKIKKLNKHVCHATFAIVEAQLDCKQCEPIEESLLDSSGGSWKILEQGTGFSPQDCAHWTREYMSKDECRALWKAYRGGGGRR